MKVAVLLDGGYVHKRLRKLKFLTSADNIKTLAEQCVDSGREQLFRIYYYDCAPYDGTERHPITGAETDFSATSVYKIASRTQQELARKENVAFRRGRLTLAGWRLSRVALSKFKKGESLSADDVEPNLKQKGVDMRIGLDMGSMATKRIVDKVVLVVRDQDFIPGMKFARREGLLVSVAPICEKALPELEEHADFVCVIDRAHLDKVLTPFRPPSSRRTVPPAQPTV